MLPALVDDVVRTIGAAIDGADHGEWLEAAADPAALTRSGVPSHFTASAVPLTADGWRVCLVLHRRIGLWVQPGGHFEPEDQSVVEAARREMVEETGLGGRVDPRPLLLSKHRAPCGVGEWHLDLQLMAIVEQGAPVVSDESLDVRWFSVHELPTDTAPGVADLVEAAARRISRTVPRGPGWPPG